jgi:ketosteroid isomerase-like protein
MSNDHPARRAAQRSMEAVHAKDKDAWVANFADDGVVEDPIGASPFDPEGKGHRGKAAIAAFWDKLIAPNRVFFDVRESFACGDECANVGSVNTVLPNGAVMVVNGVFTYRVNADGKVAALRAYWEMPRIKSVPPAARA